MLHFSESQLKGVRTKFYSRQGYYLGVFGGNVRGLPKDDQEGHVFNLIPVGLRIVSIQHQETAQYIAMNSEGRVYVTVSPLVVGVELFAFLVISDPQWSPLFVFKLNCLQA